MEIIAYSIPSMFTVFLVVKILPLKLPIYEKIIMIIFAIFLWIWLPSSMLDYMKEEQKKLSNQNIIEYFDDREEYRKTQHFWESQGLAITNAVTTINLNLRTKPTIRSKIFCSIPKNKIVNLKPVLEMRRTGNWFRVGYENTIGWAYGKYLKPVNFSEEINFISDGGEIALDWFFPEETIGEKVGAYLLGIPISILIDFLLIILFGKNFSFPLIFVRFDRDDLTMIVPIVYLYVKNSIFISYSFEQFAIMLFPIIFLAMFLSFPINKIEKILFNI